MRLLEVPARENSGQLPRLVEFLPDRITPYAILSHRWSSTPSDEISFADLEQSYRPLTFPSQVKQARKHGLKYLWIDTCCIDKRSSAELSEAINTMYTWYSKAHVCFAYLADVPSSVDLYSYDSEFTRTEWAARGWTLQELLAPQTMVFYSREWHELGTKQSLSKVLSLTTGIDEEYLANDKPKPLSSASIATRMSWAARRTTSRPEDIAYCLMGIFQVNMPMLYGEGDNAFIRLQEEIMKHSDDHSLFAWREEGKDETAVQGLLAKHPSCFKYSGGIVPYEDREPRAPFSMSNRGLRIELYLTELYTESLYAAVLDCPVPPDYEDSSFLTIYLKKLPYSNNQFARVKVGSMGKLHQRGISRPVYIRQSITVPNTAGFFPRHAIWLRKFAANDAGYRVLETVLHHGSQPVRNIIGTPATTTTQSAKSWLPNGNSNTCMIASKGETRPLLGVHIAFEETESVVILLGTAHLQIGFSLIQLPSPDLSAGERQALFTDKFVPLQPGTDAVVGYHQVRMSTETCVSDDTKYYMVDIEVNALGRPRN